MLLNVAQCCAPYTDAQHWEIGQFQGTFLASLKTPAAFSSRRSSFAMGSCKLPLALRPFSSRRSPFATGSCKLPLALRRVWTPAVEPGADGSVSFREAHREARASRPEGQPRAAVPHEGHHAQGRLVRLKCHAGLSLGEVVSDRTGGRSVRRKADRRRDSPRRGWPRGHHARRLGVSRPSIHDRIKYITAPGFVKRFFRLFYFRPMSFTLQ
jgi:hypothetical protein